MMTAYDRWKTTAPEEPAAPGCSDCGEECDVAYAVLHWDQHTPYPAERVTDAVVCASCARSRLRTWIESADDRALGNDDVPWLERL